MRLQLLGGLSVKDFLSQFWQKKPLLVRNAIPHFKGVVQAPELFALAARDDVESRLVQRRTGRWRLRRGPFARTEFAHLPGNGWTLLVQGLNLELAAADALLRRFSFIPYARLDDVMLSYAVAGGGVGPHADSYDVFLLQGPGRRRWSVSAPGDGELDPAAPLKILRNFRPEEEWLLDPGDMLYLPPGWAHDGVALEPCFTYSIGFRAPSNDELAREFLAFLQERIELAGRYADPGLKSQRHAAEIPGRMVTQAAALLAKIRWREQDITQFLGRYLSEPKPHVVFSRPRRPLTLPLFASGCKGRGLRLDLRTQMLFRGRNFFINGELHRAAAALRPWLSKLADERRLPPRARLPHPLCRLLHCWYLFGWLRIGDGHE
ncbi:MAG: cupin domain-containing protein [Burkholderiales bacterium]